MVNGKKIKIYKYAAFMNIVRKHMWAEFPEARFTYGNITAADREVLLLSKSHANDAIAIAMCGQKVLSAQPLQECQYIMQARKKKRSLYEVAPRKGLHSKNTTASRNKKNTKEAGGFYLNDCVRCDGKLGWISGLSGLNAYVTGTDGKYIEHVAKTGKLYKIIGLPNLKLVRHCNNWEYYYGT